MSKKKVVPTQEDVENFDITGTVCSMHSVPRYPELYKDREQWSMYSFDRPAYVFWNAVGKELYKNGWTMNEIKAVLQSKIPRWAMDGNLSDAFQKVGKEWAQELLNDKGLYEEVQRWAKE